MHSLESFSPCQKDRKRSNSNTEPHWQLTLCSMNQISILMTQKPVHDGDNQALSDTALNMQASKGKSKAPERNDSGHGELT